ncbi:MAG TPA: solute carrier family 23 protein [Rhodocyclaceae bacterium]|nr:solute carrier family 23 protein [Rhodocyclaceae bacterium]
MRTAEASKGRMDADDRALRRLIRRESVQALLAHAPYRDAVIVGRSGAVLHGDPASDCGDWAEIRLDGDAVGRVCGKRADDLSAALSAIADLGSENRALASDALDRYRELSMLYNVTERILEAPDIQQVASLICDEALHFLRCDSVSVLLLNEETGRLELVQTRGPAYHSRSTFEVGDDIIGDVLRSGAGEIVNDVHIDPRHVNADNALRSIVCSPLRCKGRSIGVVVAGSETERHYKAGDLQLLNALASQAGSAIDVARLYGSLRRASARPADLIYGLDDHPPAPALLVLGAQHVFIAMISLVIPVLIAAEAGLSQGGTITLVAMSLIAMGVATLLQGGRFGPIGSGHLAPQITSAIYLPPTLTAVQLGGLGLAFGMVFLAGVVGLALSQIIGRLRKLFPPEVCGIVVLMVAFSLIRVALPRFVGSGHDYGVDPAVLTVGLLTLTTMVVTSVIGVGKIRLYSAILGVLVGYAAAIATGLLGRTELEQLMELPLFAVPSLPAFDLAFSPVLLIPFVVATLASNLKVVGLITSAQKTSDANWKRPDMRSIRGGIIADSIGNLSSGLLGGAPTSVGASNVGLAAATGATARRIALSVGMMFIALAFVPRATGAVALMPAPVMGAGLLFLGCFLVISGLTLIGSRLLDTRRTYVVGLSVLAGVGLDLMPETFAAAPGWASAFVSSPLAFATTLAVCLNMVLSIGVSRKARLELPTQASIQDAVFRFLEQRGAVWGARADVIRRATPAIVEWCEEVLQVAPQATFSIGVEFDEFRLVIDVRHNDAFPLGDDFPADRIAGHLRRRYDCSAKLLQRTPGTHIRFEFEH